MKTNARRLAATTALAAFVASTPVFADSLIGLELVGPASTVSVGQTIQVRLRAKQEPQGKFKFVGQKFVAIDCILGWDPTKLKLMGLSTSGSIPLLSSYFPTPTNDYTGINEVVPPQDGTALYYALAQLGNPVSVPTTGVQVVTFNFRVESSFSSTSVSILDTLTVTTPADTVVYDGTVPGLDVTGTLTAATITQAQPCVGDINNSGAVDAADLALLLGSWGTGGAGDLDGSGVINGADLTLLLGAWGSCSNS